MNTDASTRRSRALIYGTSAAVALVLMITAVAAWRTAEVTRDAEAKADQLIDALELAGARTPARDQVVRLFGTDGGAVCANPNGTLSRANLLAQVANGAGGPGTRPTITQRRFVQAEALVINVYCPDKLPEFRQFIDGLYTVG